MSTRYPDSPRIVLRHAERGVWLEFCQPVEILQAYRESDVLPVLNYVQKSVEEKGLWAVGFLSYEAAPAFDSALQVRELNDFPLAWFGLFSNPAIITLPEIRQQERSLIDWQPSVCQDLYNASIQRIKCLIAQGETYQVNFTMRLNASFHEDAWELFLHLAKAQQASYSAYLDTGKLIVCSASPELFFRLDGEQLLSKPMKGTVARGNTQTQDQSRAEWLHNSEKNRAENVMIVDMIRNDMGRVARTGSVQVPRLFEVERYPTLWQMTSTVIAQTEAPFIDIMSALFPCASITGAPKPRTMQIITDLETTPRRVYTGCIGFYAPQRQAQFNVAIRTVLVDLQLNRAEYGVGGGIVWDSTSSDEYNECMVKAQVLTHLQPEFELLESILWLPQTGFFMLDKHLKRLSDSADYFCFSCNVQQVRNHLDSNVATLPKSAHKVRLLLAKDGVISCKSEPLDLGASAQPVHVKLMEKPITSNNIYLYHKTTWRKVYEDAQAAFPDYDDVLLWNENYELTETCLGNLVVQIGENMFTPPIECGLLPGVFRAHLLDQGLVEERVIHKDELVNCKHIYVVNSVRGMREAYF